MVCYTHVYTYIVIKQDDISMSVPNYKSYKLYLHCVKLLPIRDNTPDIDKGNQNCA